MEILELKNMLSHKWKEITRVCEQEDRLIEIAQSKE